MQQQVRSIVMKIFKRLQSWIQAMEDIEDPAGTELQRLRERIRVLNEQKVAPSLDGKRGAL
jgi:hypothetical protein